MFERLTPDLVLPSLLALDRSYLVSSRIAGLILDLDNTLVPYGEPRPSPEIADHVQALVTGGIRAVILSNASRGRAADVASLLGLPYIGNAGKPGVSGFRAAMRRMGTGPADTAVVGDQIFRDVLGARRAGCFAVLVKPLSGRDFLGTALLRGPEAMLIRYLKNRGRWPA